MKTFIDIDTRYPLPPVSPLTERDAKRLAHEDLADMSRDALALEVSRIRFVLAFGRFDKAPIWAKQWITERLDRAMALLGVRS